MKSIDARDRSVAKFKRRAQLRAKFGDRLCKASRQTLLDRVISLEVANFIANKRNDRLIEELKAAEARERFLIVRLTQATRAASIVPPSLAAPDAVGLMC